MTCGLTMYFFKMWSKDGICVSAARPEKKIEHRGDVDHSYTYCYLELVIYALRHMLTK